MASQATTTKATKKTPKATARTMRPHEHRRFRSNETTLTIRLAERAKGWDVYSSLRTGKEGKRGKAERHATEATARAAFEKACLAAAAKGWTEARSYGFDYDEIVPDAPKVAKK